MDALSKRMIWIGVGLTLLGVLGVLGSQSIISAPEHIAPDGETLSSSPIPAFGLVFQGFILAVGLILLGLGLFRRLTHQS